MAETAPAAKKAERKHVLRAVGRVVVRVYALLILLVVLWTGYTAISYLVRYVFREGQVPEQFLDPLAVPRPDPRGQPGMPATVQHPEPGISHYHRDPQPFAVVDGTGCTTSGCHTLMPHTKSKEVRAFANFHTTFLDCAACHDPRVSPPAKAVWLGNDTGRVQEPPALLQLLSSFESASDTAQTRPSDGGSRVIELLRQAEAESGVDPPLQTIRIQLETTEPGSPMWRQAIAELQTILPNRVRGEYGARITPKIRSDEWDSFQSRLVSLVREYNATTPGSPQRDAAHKKIHEQVLAKPEACITCHGGDPARFDFLELGYSAQRRAALKTTHVAQMIQHIREGRPFHYFSPLLGGPSRSDTATAPAEGANETR